MAGVPRSVFWCVESGEREGEDERPDGCAMTLGVKERGAKRKSNARRVYRQGPIDVGRTSGGVWGGGEAN